jgi:hypothetical protein
MYEILFMVRSFRSMGWPIFIMTIIHICLPFGSRAIDGLPVAGNRWNDYLFIGCTMILNTFNFWANMYFISLNFSDFHRKEAMMEVMSTVIDSKDRELSQYGGYLPAINIYCPYTLYSWLNLRHCLLDFCRKYTLRIQTYSAVIIPFYLLQFLLLALTLVFSLPLNFIKETNAYMFVGFETVLIFVIVVKSLFAGAAANSYFMRHKEILLNLKEDLVIMRNLNKSKTAAISFSMRKKVHDLYNQCP